MLLLLSFLFLFSEKINGQIEPRLLQQKIQYYDLLEEEFIHVKDIFHKYDREGNLIEKNSKDYDTEGEIRLWTGDKYDIDEKGLLQKRTARRYNWDLDIWINRFFYDYKYDENDCLIESVYLENQVSGGRTETYIILNNEDCQPIESNVFYYREDTLYAQHNVINDYSNGKIIKRTRRNYDIQEPSKLIGISFYNFNEYEDLFELFNYKIDGTDTVLNTMTIMDFGYNFYTSNNLLRRLTRTSHQIRNRPTGLDTTFTISYEKNYTYSCDDLLVEQDLKYASTYFHASLGIYFNQAKTSYIYEGENPCFNNDDRTRFAIQLFPNPATDIVQIECFLLRSGNTQLKIFDINGRVVLEKFLPSREGLIPLDVSHLPNGTYVIQLTNDDFFETEKLLIVK